MVEGLKTWLVAKDVKSGLSYNGGDAQHRAAIQNCLLLGISMAITLIDVREFTANYSRELPCNETTGVNTSGLVPASSPPNAVAVIIFRMHDGPLLGEELVDFKSKARFTTLGGLAGSPIPWAASCKSKGLNDSVVLPNGMGGDTMEDMHSPLESAFILLGGEPTLLLPGGVSHVVEEEDKVEEGKVERTFNDMGTDFDVSLGVIYKELLEKKTPAKTIRKLKAKGVLKPQDRQLG
ncbi:hypothetical protein AMTR_s00128p00073290 [Amborella trichopoda]|uniref:Uncharacterized protein n=1 Tax=Amborella trichopoda TaxID=13333 RepID=W1NPY2_AMBTC|nr:hypothetical protein AMTR_s00128p00073290 [Amborella trichopoda]